MKINIYKKINCGRLVHMLRFIILSQKNRLLKRPFSQLLNCPEVVTKLFSWISLQKHKYFENILGCESRAKVHTFDSWKKQSKKSHATVPLTFPPNENTKRFCTTTDAL